MKITDYNGEWLNAPKVYDVSDEYIRLMTQPQTDFWQKTNYGYRRNTGHAYLLPIDKEDFTFDVRVSFKGKELYDQAGLFLYFDEENWAKASLETGLNDSLMLGSVVTCSGYSDWAIAFELKPCLSEIYYRLHKKDHDYLIEYSIDGTQYNELRMFHLPVDRGLKLGIYACSPMDSSFEAIMDHWNLQSLKWNEDTHI